MTKYRGVTVLSEVNAGKVHMQLYLNTGHKCIFDLNTGHNRKPDVLGLNTSCTPLKSFAQIEKMCVVYFDQRLGAAQPKRWSNYSFSAFLC